MVSINLYQPKKLDITLNFPSAWNDLLPKEVIFIAKALLEQTEKNANATRPRLLRYLTESAAQKEKKKLPQDWYLSIDAEQAVTDVFPILDFIFNKNDRTECLAPFEIGKEKYFPVPFKEITCGEYEDCEVFANTFSNAPSPESLASLAAILFRPKKGADIEPYMQYNYRTDSYLEYKAEKKQKLFLKQHPEELYAVFIWYAGCRNQLPEMFPTVYDGPKGEPDMLAFTNCIHSGAGPKNGTREKIRCMKLYEFMYDMEREAIHAKEMEAEIEKMKNQH